MFESDLCNKILSDALQDAQQLVTDLLSTISGGMPAADSIAEMVHLAKQLEALSELADNCRKAFDAQVDFFKKVHIPELMNDQDLTSCSVETPIGKFHVGLENDMYVNVPAAAREELKDWLRDNEADSLITETVNASSLKAFVKNAYLNDLAWPEEIVKMTPYQKVKISKR